METLSIIIPAYNAAAFIEGTVRSALAVKGVESEVIVVDDGSTDETSKICQRLGDAVRWKKTANGGVSRARNIGAELANGDWFLFLDSDDTLEPDGPASLLGAASKTGAGVAYGLVKERRSPPKEPRVTGQNYAEGIPPHPALRNYWRCAVITPGSAVIRRKLHERIGGFVPGYEPMEDRDYWIKAGLLAACAHVESVVLDKTWQPVSAGKMDAKRIWNGLRSRFALPGWCTAHDIDWPKELPRDDKSLLEKAVNEAVWCGCWEIVAPLLQECRRCGVMTFWTIRAALGLALRGGGKSFPRPDWLAPLR